MELEKGKRDAPFGREVMGLDSSWYLQVGSVQGKVHRQLGILKMVHCPVFEELIKHSKLKDNNVTPRHPKRVIIFTSSMTSLAIART